MNNEPTSTNPALTLELGDGRQIRRTKIVATLGPASESREVLSQMIANGLDVVRLNFSHGSAGEHAERARLVRELAAEYDRNVGIIGDLQGPKIRIERFAAGEVRLAEGADFVLDAELARDDGDAGAVGITYKDLPGDVERGDKLLLDDGRIVLQVERVQGARIHTRVLMGGPLSNNKGINRQGGGLSAEAITEKDAEDIRTAAEIDIDYLAVSFPRHGDDIEHARRLFLEAGGEGGIIAKIERAEALDAIDGILEVSDAIMIARGDLGVEIGDAELPPAQKSLIRAARAANVPVITATQMMESMINSPLPTRAEVFDVANAVLDGTDAVMLSAETASGNYPVETVQAMGRVCAGVDQHPSAQVSDHRMEVRFERTDEAIAMATMYVANHLDVRAIASLTESGSTPLWMSRISSGIPIYALTHHERTSRRVSLYRGVYAFYYPIGQVRPDEANRKAIEVLRERGAVETGDRVIITKGDLMGVGGGTNSLKVVVVGTDDNLVPHTE